jgi:hypothetical protein
MIYSVFLSTTRLVTTMRKMKQISRYAVLLALTVFLTQCKNASNVDPSDEGELITTVRLLFTEQGSGTLRTFEFQDKDGEGGNPPTRFDRVVLPANSTFALTIELLDESKPTPIDITKEVQEEADEHLFVFTTTPAGLITYTYGDRDSRGLPVGIVGTARSGNPGMGTFKVQLRHQTPRNGQPRKDGTPGPGSDDVNLDFPLTIQ